MSIAVDRNVPTIVRMLQVQGRSPENILMMFRRLMDMPLPAGLSYDEKLKILEPRESAPAYAELFAGVAA